MVNKDKKIIEKEIEKYAEIEELSNTRGGKQLMDCLKSEIVEEIDNLISKYREKPEELVSIVARIDEKLYLLRKMTKASDNKQIALEALEERRE